MFQYAYISDVDPVSFTNKIMKCAEDGARMISHQVAVIKKSKTETEIHHFAMMEREITKPAKVANQAPTRPDISSPHDIGCDIE